MGDARNVTELTCEVEEWAIDFGIIFLSDLNVRFVQATLTRLLQQRIHG